MSVRFASEVIFSLWFVTACTPPEFDFNGADAGAGAGGSGGTEAGGSAGSATAGTGGSSTVIEHCENRSADSDETDVDCGGLDCAPCRSGQRCSVPDDCENGECNAGRCQSASCADEQLDNGESDIDCGGINCSPCVDGDACALNGDCESGKCSSKVCQAPTCSDRVENGDESGTDCGGSCPGCAVGEPCVVAADCEQPPQGMDGVTECESGTCTIACPVWLGDCNEQASDGCEANLATDVANCGACGAGCSPENAAAALCTGLFMGCNIDKSAGNDGCLGTFRDCNNDPADGCEIDVAADGANCGACGTACSSLHSSPTCVASACVDNCDPGYADCDDDALASCEINTNASSSRCGGCLPGDANSGTGQTCTVVDPSTQSPFCNAGSCDFSVCSPGTGDCDGASDGNSVCEDALNTITNCGACGEGCSVANGTSACNVDSCEVASCSSGNGVSWADCNGLYADGCERNIEMSNQRCGGCIASDAEYDNGQVWSSGGQDCTAKVGFDHVVTTSCAAGACKIEACNIGYADCDGVFADGCEVNTVTDATHCAGCTSGPTTKWDGGTVCDGLYAHGSGVCAASKCSFEQCDGGYGDCNGDASLGASGNGCETYLVGNDQNCAGCGTVCITNSQTSGNTCSASGGLACSPTCSSASYYDCDGDGTNGCEGNLTLNTSCGSCNGDCTTKQGFDSVLATACGTNETCEVATCATNMKDCNGIFSDGCEVRVDNNVARCGGCLAGDPNPGSGVACASKGNSTVSCNSGACAWTCTSGFGDLDGDLSNSGSNGCEARAITYVNHLSGTADPAVRTSSVSFNLTNGSASNQRRAVFVLESNRANQWSPTVSFNGVSMTRAVSGVVNNQGEPAIFYLTEENLPPNAGAYSVDLTLKDPAGSPWGSFVYTILELSGVERDADTGAIYDTGTSSGACPITTTSTVDVVAGGWVLTVASNAGNYGSAAPNGSLVEILDAFEANAINHGAAGYIPWSGLTAGTNKSFNFFTISSCYGSSTATVSLRPAGS